MKVKLFERSKTMTLARFADENNLVLEIHERNSEDLGERWTPKSRYFTQFEHCDVKEGNVLCGIYGNGSSQDEAMLDYAKQISGKTLVVFDLEIGRREIYCPILSTKIISEDKIVVDIVK